MCHLTPPCTPNIPHSPAVRRRKLTTVLASLFTLLALIFTLLVIIGSTNSSRVLSSIYFLRIDVSSIIPRSFPNAVLVNSIAQTLGLRDFYQVGLWNYCEGYKREGVTYCARPRPLYAFDPVEVLLSQLLAGAEKLREGSFLAVAVNRVLTNAADPVAVPASIESALDMARAVSHWMFGLWFVGLCFLAMSFGVGWIDYTSHTSPLLTSILSFLSLLFTTVAAVLSTALFAVFRSVFEERPDLNIRGSLGKKMFAFVWLSVGFAAAAFVLRASLCCCAKRRRERRERREWCRVRREWDRRGLVETGRESMVGGGNGGSSGSSARGVDGEKAPEEGGGYGRGSMIGRAY